MYANQYEEHMTHSAPCASRWDGFDRGTNFDAPDITETIVGRMTNGAGQRVMLKVTEFEFDAESAVYVDGARVYCDLFDTAAQAKAKAIVIGHWWMDGCPC